MMQWGYGGGGGWGWGLAGGVLCVLFLAAVVVGIVLVVRALIGHPHTHGQWTSPPPAGPTTPTTMGPSPALRVLEERYAKGEIDREEFLARKQDLMS